MMMSIADRVGKNCISQPISDW